MLSLNKLQQTDCSIPSLSSLYTAWNWNLSAFDSQSWVKDIFLKSSAIRYPVKLLRYWFMFNLLREQQVRLQRPLRICEIGVDRGQMLRFTRAAGLNDFACWVAVDYKLQPELADAGYTKQIEANVDSADFNLDEKFDVIIVLHLLEHLYEPELLANRLSTALAADGIMIGGFPVTPNFLAAYWQKKIRLTAAKFGHVSVFSPQRVQSMAKSCGLGLDFLSGTYLMRKNNFFLENWKAWLRVNLIFGALFPALAGEIYWRMRK
jgi:SAM-dependent methyltransferase